MLGRCLPPQLWLYIPFFMRVQWDFCLEPQVLKTEEDTHWGSAGSRALGPARAWLTQSTPNKGGKKRALEKACFTRCHQDPVLKPSRASQPLQDKIRAFCPWIHVFIHSTDIC